MIKMLLNGFSLKLLNCQNFVAGQKLNVWVLEGTPFIFMKRSTPRIMFYTLIFNLYICAAVFCIGLT